MNAADGRPGLAAGPGLDEETEPAAAAGAGEEPGALERMRAGEESGTGEETGAGTATAAEAAGLDAGTGAGEESGTGEDGGRELDGSWLHGEELRSLRQHWRGVQVSFVDEPGKAVRDANTLVADLMRRLAQALFDERAALEMRCLGHDDVSTEELRQGLRRYRAIFDRLLTITW